MEDYDLAMEGYDSYDMYLEEEEEYHKARPLPAEPEPRQIVVQPKSQPSRLTQVRHIDVSPVRAAGRKHVDMPRLKLSLEDVDEEEAPRLQQTGNTTGTGSCGLLQSLA